MRNLFRILKIRIKLVIAFTLVAAIVLFMGIRQYNVLFIIGKNQKELINIVELTKAIKDLKYTIAYQNQLSQSILETYDTTRLIDVKRRIQNEQLRLAPNFDLVLQITNTDSTNDVQMQNLSRYVKDAKLIYASQFLSTIDSLYNYQRNLILGESASDMTGNNSSIISGFLPGFRRSETSLTPDTMTRAAFTPSVAEYASNEETNEIKRSLEKYSFQIIDNFNQSETIINKLILASGQHTDDTINYYNSTALLVSVVGLLIALLIAWLISKDLTSPIQLLKNSIQRLSKGELPEIPSPKNRDEIGDMSVLLSQMVTGLTDTARFSLEIGKGNYQASFNPLSDKDILGNSLLDMRKSLKEAAEEEHKRKEEDTRRNWATEGFAQFSEILRHQGGNIVFLAEELIKKLVKYLDANQCGMFLIENENQADEHLALIAAFAYDRKKYYQKKIKPGVGLVGTVFIEKGTIYLEEIPDDYIEIGSGLGSSNPNFLLLVPMRIDENVLGVIEIASFKSLAPYQIEFVEKVAESIASTFANIRINERTALLLEQSQRQAEEMAIQEQQRQKSIRELQQTQFEALKREEEIRIELDKVISQSSEQKSKLTNIESEIEEVNFSLKTVQSEREQFKNFIYDIIAASTEGVLIINSNEKIVFANKAVSDIWGVLPSDLIDKNVRVLTDDDYLTTLMRTQFEKALLVPVELSIIKGDQSNATITLKALLDKTSTEKRYICFIRDLSHIHNLETKLQHVADNLRARDLELDSHKERINQLIAQGSGNKSLDQIQSDNDLLINFNTELITEIDIIDKQHKAIVDSANKFYSEIRKGALAGDLTDFFNDLVKLVKENFKFEEKWFQDLEYESQNEHKKLHKTFALKLLEFKDLYKKGDNGAPFELMKYLKEWLYTHFSQTDKTYVQLFKDNGVS